VAHCKYILALAKDLQLISAGSDAFNQVAVDVCLAFGRERSDLVRPDEAGTGDGGLINSHELFSLIVIGRVAEYVVG
jgi:hypothetical protein